MTITACGGSDTPKTAAPVPTTRAPLGTLAPTSSTSTPAATTTTAPATTTAAPTTAPASTTAPAPGATTTVPRCADSPDAKTCTLDTVPLRSDIDQILDVYRRFTAEDLKISQNPDTPDWDAYLAMVHPLSRDAARSDIQGHFDRGEILNTSLGITINPRSTQAPNLGDDHEIIEDCRVDGSYWSDRASGSPVAGATASVRRVYFLTDMRRVDGAWLVEAYRHLDQPC